MNCPHWTSPATKEQSKNTSLASRTFRYSACHSTFNEGDFHPVQLARRSHRGRPSGCLLAAALQGEPAGSGRDGLAARH